ncbi:MAG: hypothetical protein ACI80S_001620 [Pseudohongiellaceae bacterium]|jgi:hypothetical protein
MTLLRSHDETLLTFFMMDVALQTTAAAEQNWLRALL